MTRFRIQRSLRKTLPFLLCGLCLFIGSQLNLLVPQWTTHTYAHTVGAAFTKKINASYHTKNATHIPGISRETLNYILQPRSICDDPELFLVSYIHTSPTHFARRMAIRQTWGNPSNIPDMRTRVIFVVGRANNTPTERTLASENKKYGDMLQGNFVDSYKNLTYKGVTALRWISENCEKIPFVLKADDDIMVNVFQLLRHLKVKKKFGVSDRKLIYCLVWYGMKVIRDRKNKWYVPPELWPSELFPTYCSGSAFVLSGDMIPDMYKTALEVPFFWVDDLYVTGLLVHKLGVKHESMHSTYIMDGKFKQHFGSNNFTSKIFGVNIGGANNMYSIWKTIIKSFEKIQNGEPLS